MNYVQTVVRRLPLMLRISENGLQSYLVNI